MCLLLLVHTFQGSHYNEEYFKCWCCDKQQQIAFSIADSFDVSCFAKCSANWSFISVRERNVLIATPSIFVVSLTWYFTRFPPYLFSLVALLRKQLAYWWNITITSSLSAASWIIESQNLLEVRPAYISFSVTFQRKKTSRSVSFCMFQ